MVFISEKTTCEHTLRASTDGNIAPTVLSLVYNMDVL